MEASTRPSVDLLILGVLWLAGNVLAAITAVVISGIAGWDLQAISGEGADVGRASIQIASGGTVVDEVVPIWGTALFQVPLWGALVAAPIVVARGWTAMLERYRVTHRWRDAPAGAGAGLLTQLLLLPMLYWVLFSLFGDADVGRPARELAARVDGTFGTVVFVVFVAVVAPIAEELAFRGVLLRSLERLMAPGWALVVSAGLFAAVHFQFLQFPGLFVFGLVAGALAQRRNGLVAPIAAHMAFNATAAFSVLTS
ncbi:MAG: CPBP family intramembrane metalloprotease [Acidimicrobiia bacterium]|nr:CPBP family intramembrane metalloprotease [Acidimicrobiia bacterium]